MRNAPSLRRCEKNVSFGSINEEDTQMVDSEFAPKVIPFATATVRISRTDWTGLNFVDS